MEFSYKFYFDAGSIMALIILDEAHKIAKYDEYEEWNTQMCTEKQPDKSLRPRVWVVATSLGVP